MELFSNQTAGNLNINRIVLCYLILAGTDCNNLIIIQEAIAEFCIIYSIRLKAIVFNVV
jgi:hypothetical protein